jgi:phosphoribosyl 1,2-cyclic phosphodiesterase
VLRFRSLASGSAGNATLIQASDGAGTRPVRLLVDCGLSLRQIECRLRAAGVEIADLDALFITHEHADHLGHALPLAARAGIPVWASRGTWHVALANAGAALAQAIAPLQRFACDRAPIAIGALLVEPFTVPHDTREPLQLRASDGARRLGLLTDLGHVTPHAIDMLQGCQALLLESNHDPGLLERSSYPPFLKRRIQGPHGHLSNAQARHTLAQIKHPGLATVVAAHLSERNNRPELVRAGWAETLGCAPGDVRVAARQGLDWIEVGS